MSVKYCLPVPVFHFRPKLTHPAARSLCDSWATCFKSWLVNFSPTIKVANKFSYLLTYLIPCASLASVDRGRNEWTKMDRVIVIANNCLPPVWRQTGQNRVREQWRRSSFNASAVAATNPRDNASGSYQCRSWKQASAMQRRVLSSIGRTSISNAANLWDYDSTDLPQSRARSGTGDCVRLPTDVRSEMWITLVSCSMGGHFPRCHIGEHLPPGIRRQYTSIEHRNKENAEKNINGI